MKLEMNAGIIVDTIKAAVLEHGATAETEVRIRIGATGPVYSIHAIKAQKEGRAFRLIMETEILPDLTQ